MLDHLIATKRNIAEGTCLANYRRPSGKNLRSTTSSAVECAEDVRDFLAVSSNSRPCWSMMPDYEEPAAGRDRTWMGWFQSFRFCAQPALRMASALAMCVLTVVTTLQSITLRGQLVPQAVPSSPCIRMRGERKARSAYRGGPVPGAVRRRAACRSEITVAGSWRCLADAADGRARLPARRPVPRFVC